tara:strand:- start:521 stop:745 length:225 start_codon:yes stop_codon:yes gene_type:complete
MEWTFTFVTYDRRELHDYKYQIVVEEDDSYAEALKQAVKELPLGEEDNPYSRKGVEWHVESVSVDDEEVYTNDE